MFVLQALQNKKSGSRKENEESALLQVFSQAVKGAPEQKKEEATTESVWKYRLTRSEKDELSRIADYLNRNCSSYLHHRYNRDANELTKAIDGIARFFVTPSWQLPFDEESVLKTMQALKESGLRLNLGKLDREFSYYSSDAWTAKMYSAGENAIRYLNDQLANKKLQRVVGML